MKKISHLLYSLTYLLGATLLCFITLEVITKIFLFSYLTWRTQDAFSPTKYNDETLKILYNTHDPQSYRETIDQVWHNEGEYHPFVDHSESPTNKKYLHITPQKFRMIQNQVPWIDKNRKNIFFFGGSTTFGFGVKDEETIPSYFQEELFKSNPALKNKTAVYNFGTGSYYSTIERIRFEQLLSQSIIPHTAIFVDGLNEIQQELEDRAPNSEYISYLTHHTPTGIFVRDLSLMTFFERVSNKISKIIQKKSPSPQNALSYEDAIKHTLTRITNNHKMIRALCKEYGIRVLFVQQPIPYYHYDASQSAVPKHSPPWAPLPELAKRFYETWLPVTSDTLRLQDFKVQEQMYVDEVHYSPMFTHAIAKEILHKLDFN